MKGAGENRKTKLHFVHCNAPQIVFFIPGHRKSRNAASNLTTGLHREPHPPKCPIADTCKIFGSSCPRCFADDQYFDVPCRSKSGCGPTIDLAVDSAHNVLISDQRFTEYCSTNCTTRALQSCRISCQGRDQSVAAGGPTARRSSLRHVTSILLRFFSKSSDDLQQNKPLE